MSVPNPFNTLVSALTALLLLTGPIGAKTISVGTSAALVDAYQAAKPGDVIALAPGEYRDILLKGGGGTAQQPLTIVSQDPASLARINRFILRDASHVVIERIILDYTFKPSDKLKARPFRIQASKQITLRDMVFDGDLAHDMDAASNGLPAGFGLAVSNTNGLTLENSEIYDFWRGLTMRESSNLQIIGNDLHGLRMDGMNFAQVSDTLIEGNRIRDFKRSTDKRDHADMIQFWTAHTDAPSRNITIRGNLLMSGKGMFTQSIFMGNNLVDRGKAGEEMYFRNITIENNVIINAHAHGISLGASIGVNIANNTLVRNPASDGPRDIEALYRPRLSVSPLSRDVAIVGNIANSFVLPEGETGWRIERNLAVQDIGRLQPNHYSTVFVGGDRAGPAAYLPLPGGVLDGSNIGAAIHPWLE